MRDRVFIGFLIEFKFFLFLIIFIFIEVYMKLKLNKKSIKSLSKDKAKLTPEMTVKVGGGIWWPTDCLRTICMIVVTE